MRNYDGVAINRKLANAAIPHSSFLIPNSSDVLSAFAADNGPLADAIKALLNDPSTEAAEKLLSDLPTLLPDDPALAAVIAEEMAKQFTDPAGQKMAAGRHTDSQDSQALTKAARDTGYLASANNEDQPRGKTSPGSTPGSFAPAAGSCESSKAEDAKKDNTGYSDENRSRIGQTGTWNELGLPSLRDIAADEPIGKTKIAEARKRISSGETIVDPLGKTHEISSKTLSHWSKKGKAISDVKERLQLLDEAEETISRPHEIWSREDGRGKSFVRIVKSDTGRFVMNVAEMVDDTISWHHNEVKFDYWRHGKLEYIRG